MKKKVFIVIAAVLVIVLLSMQLLSNKEKIDSKKKVVDLSAKQVTVTVKEVIKRENKSTLSLVGTTIAKNEVILQSEVAAQVKEINFKIGDDKYDYYSVIVENKGVKDKYYLEDEAVEKFTEKFNNEFWKNAPEYTENMIYDPKCLGDVEHIRDSKKYKL